MSVRLGTLEGLIAKRFLSLACLLTLLSACPATNQSEGGAAAPALWEVERGNAKVYLFGRMAVPSDTDWLTPPISRAFAESNALWLENPPADADQVNEYIAEHGFEEGYSVVRQLDGEDHTRLIAALEAAGMSPSSLDGNKAWLAYLMVTNATGLINSVDGAFSPDAVFRGIAETQGKEVGSEWVNFQQFVEFTIALPESVHLQMIRRALTDSESYAALLDAWLRGDLEALTRVAEDWAERYPDAYTHINAQRNRAWAERVLEMLSEGDVHFVSLGIGHFVGPDNLLTLLEAAGLSVRRL
jgi:uncharacterized protein